MQTIYYSTSNFIRHTGNMVDLDEFRRKLALAQAQQDALARQPQAHWQERPAQAFQPRVIAPQFQSGDPQPKSRPRRRRRDSLSLLLDACASLGVVAMTLAFAVQVMV